MNEILKELNRCNNAKKEAKELYSKKTQKPIVLNFTKQHIGHFVLELEKRKKGKGSNTIYVCKDRSVPQKKPTVYEAIVGKYKKCIVDLPIVVNEKNVITYSVGTPHHNRSVIVLQDEEVENIQIKKLQERIAFSEGLARFYLSQINNIREAFKEADVDVRMEKLREQMKNYAEIIDRKKIKGDEEK